VRTLTLLSAVILLLPGCYVYRPVDAPPPPGTPVRLDLTPAGAVAAGEVTGRGDRTIDGNLVSSDPDTLRLEILTDREVSDFRRGREFRAGLAFPSAQVEGVSVRSFSWARSLLVGAAAGAAVWLAVDQVVSGGDDDGGSGNGNPNLTTIFRLGVPVSFGR
jgi:hypothetical protein